MAIFTIHHPWAFAFGLLGNIISFMVYLSPVSTFYRVYKRKSTEGFQSIPYVVALFSAMLWIYYAFLKPDGSLLLTINSIGCVVETIYIAMYIAYAPKKAKMLTMKLLLSLNFGVFSLILLLTQALVKGSQRLRVLGWVCVAFSIIVFAAPLSIVRIRPNNTPTALTYLTLMRWVFWMRLVIRTKSVEFMPFSLSFFLTLSAVTWFAYGILLKDLFIALPNVLGFILGLLQMILYMIYRGRKTSNIQEQKLPEHTASMVKLNTMVSSEVFPIDKPKVNDGKIAARDVQSLTGGDGTGTGGSADEAQPSECEV